MNAANFTSRPKVSFFHALFPQAVLRHEYWNGFLGAVDEENVEPQNEGEVVAKARYRSVSGSGLRSIFSSGGSLRLLITASTSTR
ncbi:hypothetical protein [Thermococcus litoralis]|nr:hypothetical protein [Thermococcus litoralis]